MKRSLMWAMVLALPLLANSASAEEQSVTLKLDNFYCASCAYILQKTLAAIDGVADCQVSYRQQTASVIYDDAETNVAALTAATLSVLCIFHLALNVMPCAATERKRNCWTRF